MDAIDTHRLHALHAIDGPPEVRQSLVAKAVDMQKAIEFWHRGLSRDLGTNEAAMVAAAAAFAKEMCRVV